MTTVNYKINNTGGLLTKIGYNGSSWGTTANSNVVVTNNPAGLEVKGKIIHNGKDLEERLSTIEKVLMIPQRDVKMEDKYPKLKKLYEEYMSELEKYTTWERIKNDYN